MRETERLGRIPAYLFAELERKIAEKKAAGVDVISLGIGDPDTPTFRAHRGGDAAAVRGPEHPPVPVQPRAARSSGRRSPSFYASGSASSSTRRRR